EFAPGKFVSPRIVQHGGIGRNLRLQVLRNCRRLRKGEIPETFQIGTHGLILRAGGKRHGQQQGGGKNGAASHHPSVSSKRVVPISFPSAFLADRRRR